MKIDVFITGSSRPSIYPIFWESFKKRVKVDHSKITVYEDVILPKESAKVKKYIKPKVDSYIETPFQGLGYVYNEILKKVNTKYFLYLQEDWEFIDEGYDCLKNGKQKIEHIDVNKLIEIMDDNPFIKQIWFPKRMQKNHWNDHTGEVITLNEIILTEWQGSKEASPSSWAFLPHIVRTDFIRKEYKKANCHVHRRPEQILKNWFVNQFPQNKTYYDRLSWILGNRKEYIKHLGAGEFSTKELIKKR